MNNRRTFHHAIAAVLALAALVRLAFFFDAHEIWWDSGAYIGMGKFLWSLGTVGVWEHIRPVLWPAVLGVFWLFSLDVFWWAKLLTFFLSISSIGLVYAIGKKVLSGRAALFASILFGFSAVFFFFTFNAYTEIPAVFLALAGVYALLKEKPFVSGVLFGLAFLTKFPAGIFLLLGVGVFAFRKQWRQAIVHGAGFGIPAGAYLVANAIVYQDPFGPLLAAQDAISSVLGCNVLRFRPWWQYVVWVFVDNWLNLAALAGIVVAVRRRSWFVLAALALPVLYFFVLHCREYRYVLFFLPFIALLTGTGLEWIEQRLPRAARRAFVLFVVGVSVFNAVLFYQGNVVLQSPAQEQYFSWLAEHPVQGEVWASNPVVSAYADVLVNKIYYPIYQEGRALEFNAYLRGHHGRIGAVLLDNCGGGIVCPPGDQGCAAELEAMRDFLNENFRQVFFAEHGNCWYAVYAKERS